MDTKPFARISSATIHGAASLWCSNRAQAEAIYGPIENWDVSSVTNMSELFSYEREFNDDISRWDVRNVTDMSEMFHCAKAFNQPLNSWNVTNVKNMAEMFNGASVFNQPLDRWNTGQVTTYLFSSTKVFNQALETWDVSAVTDMSDMFSFAISFNQSLSSWNTANVTIMSHMFEETEFNQPIDAWNVSKVTNVGGMFHGATMFNQPLESWNVVNVTNMSYMFHGASSFNQQLQRWTVPESVNTTRMFDETYNPEFFPTILSLPVIPLVPAEVAHKVIPIKLSSTSFADGDGDTIPLATLLEGLYARLPLDLCRAIRQTLWEPLTYSTIRAAVKLGTGNRITDTVQSSSGTYDWSPT